MCQAKEADDIEKEAQATYNVAEILLRRPFHSCAVCLVCFWEEKNYIVKSKMLLEYSRIRSLNAGKSSFLRRRTRGDKSGAIKRSKEQLARCVERTGESMVVNSAACVCFYTRYCTCR